MLAGKDDGRALEQAELVLARELAEGDDGAREGDGAHEGANEQLDAVAHRDGLTVADDVEGPRLGHAGDGDEHRRQADHRVHEGHQLGHLGHFHPARHDGAGRAAHQQAKDDQRDAGTVGLGAGGTLQLQDQRHGSDDGDQHAHHAEDVAAARGGGVRQPLQSLDEAHRGHQVQQNDEIHAHQNAPENDTGCAMSGCQAAGCAGTKGGWAMTCLMPFSPPCAAPSS